ncbi:HlyD family efflux transporter periplasmic adaptor subunit [Sedimentibacter hydroxybenzoicus DSM 7310]|uniref:HlyD family efflux transporter periplasmic adaptor subunit n=1 Tax=Sedimentibacter hydroxybenzoicus DSM 7310 TaxID=1123245 RepID=A0A974GVT4_SEDHY|nr:HlyD family efflux transporter periplasmic adaptor subunit [Sedimentibacter hydroxybenzoicus]NYB73747.1 HlyD family efflux transporter periplasmic adaptor subunit [Sedimentibacter hydroxybenzoicus DSM 7310]
MQKKYIKALISFFIIIFILTILSRVADSVTVAVVMVQTPRRGSINHEIVIEGSIEASGKNKIKIQEGFRIDAIYAERGQRVAKGDKLLYLGKEEIEKQLSRLQIEIEILELNRQNIELQTYENIYEEEIKRAQIALDRALNDRDINIQINGVELESDKRAVEDAEISLNLAVKQKEKQDAKNEEDLRKNENEKKRLELELQMKRNEYKDIEELNKVDNIVYAEEDGIVDEIYVKEGEKTTGGEVISIIDSGAEYIFTGKADAEKAKYMKAGDTISIKLSGKTISIDNVEIKSIIPEPEDSTVKITAVIPENSNISPGMSATARHIYSTDEYPRIIPIRALRNDNGQYYVLAVEEKNTVMGKEKISYRVNVEVADKNDSLAAISSVGNEEIIIKSNKPISEGERVRVEK